MTLQRLLLIIQEFITNKCYGEFVIKIEAGKIVNVKKTESLK